MKRSDRLWFAPHRRLGTKAAAAGAARAARWVRTRRPTEADPPDTQLFEALHACAYLAKRECDRRSGTLRQEVWRRRWARLRDYLVERNLGLVYSLMQRMRASDLDRDDILSESMLALTQSVERFDPWRGFRFSTYACNAILRAVARRSRREARHRQTFPAAHDPKLDVPAPPDEQTALAVERLQRALAGNLGRLNAIETQVLKQRFFPNAGTRPLTFREIGDTIGLSKERVRQIQQVALHKLKQTLMADPLLG